MMKLQLVLIAVFSSFVLTYGVDAVAQSKPRECIRLIRNYVIYYGSGRVNDLARFDLAIVQPDTLTESELSSLRTRGTLAVAYLSLGEVEPQRPWYSDGRINAAWILGKNPHWGSFYIDVNQPGWQELIISLAREYMKKGYDGVFLDTVDTLNLFPQTLPAFINLIHRLRISLPDALLIQNRGFAILDRVVSDLDALMFESLSSTYDFQRRQYVFIDNTALAQQIAQLHKQTGLPILALDYAPVDNPAMARLARQKARSFGFISAVSVIHLTDIPDYELLIRKRNNLMNWRYLDK